MLKSSIVVVLLLSCLGFVKLTEPHNDIAVNENMYLSDVLIALGDSKPLHFFERRRDTMLIRQGKEIVFTGITTTADGKKTKRQSKHFTCTHCHTTVQEDPDIRTSDPEARLKYCAEKNIPFLPGSTFHGIVNRETWYNGDYLKKYGNLVRPARDTLKNAIHLCAVECSQGRALEGWEMEAVMAYLYSIELKLGDLNLSPQDYEEIKSSMRTKSNGEMIRQLKSKYYLASPATFLDPIAKHERECGVKGNPENGKHLYDLSCKHCHAEGGVTNFILDDEKITFRFLRAQFKTTYHFSIYDKIRKGTYAMNGYKPYMPNYTLERMSHQQLEDLAAYINQQANR